MTLGDEVKSGEAQLLDVRTAEEWNEGHAEYALHIPVDELYRGKTDVLLPAKKIYVYCASGGRADMAVQYLQEFGFHAENVGGLRDWVHISTLEKN